MSTLQPQLCVHVDGERVPTRPLTRDYTNGQFVRTFETFFTRLWMNNKDESVDIRRFDYPCGYTISSLPLPRWTRLRDLRSSAEWNCTFEIEFATPLADTVSVIVYAEFENQIEISSSKDVILDYWNVFIWCHSQLRITLLEGTL